MVALVFSLLLFAILVFWVVLTSAYAISIDKSCDVPFKANFWLVTLQLILDVFWNDIMQIHFQWDANSNQQIPGRAIAYNNALQNERYHIGTPVCILQQLTWFP
jgi:hypothetical protein